MIGLPSGAGDFKFILGLIEDIENINQAD